MDIDEANKVIHCVETQWHYATMIAAGYRAETKEQTGFVRHYVYVHPETGRRIKVCTGLNADYWEDLETKKFGYWRELEPHLKANEENHVGLG